MLYPLVLKHLNNDGKKLINGTKIMSNPEKSYLKYAKNIETKMKISHTKKFADKPISFSKCAHSIFS